MLLQQPPPMPVHQYNAQDEAHLKIISVCHYVMGGFYLLGIGFVILHFVIVSMFFQRSEASAHTTTPTATAITVEATPSAPLVENSEGEIIQVEPTGMSPSELLALPPSATASPSPAAPGP